MAVHKPDKTKPTNVRASWPYSRQHKRKIAERYTAMCQELGCRPSKKKGRTRRGRQKGDSSKSGIIRAHKPFPYPKHGKHLVRDGVTIPVGG